MDYAHFSAKMKQHGFEEHLKADAETVGHWSRVTNFGGQIDRGTGKKPVVYIDVNLTEQTCTMSIASFPLKSPGMISIAREGIPLEDMARNLKSYEQGIIYGWREIAD